MKYLNYNQIKAQQHYIPINNFKVFNKKNLNLPGTKNYFDNSISIPIYVNLNMRDQNKIIKVIKNYFTMNN